MAAITHDRIGYESYALGALGQSDIPDFLPAGFDYSNYDPSGGLWSQISAGGGGVPSWTQFLMPIEQAGLKIATNVTNPAYNTPGSYTRMPDGTVIATAGTQQTGFTSVAPGGMSLNPLVGGGSLNMGTILLLGGAVLVFAMMGRK